jgi:hypothetical protein
MSNLILNRVPSRQGENLSAVRPILKPELFSSGNLWKLERDSFLLKRSQRGRSPVKFLISVLLFTPSFNNFSHLPSFLPLFQMNLHL